jgi:hypothetical protein
MRTRTMLVHGDGADRHGDTGARRHARRRRALELALAAVVLEVGALWLRSGRLAGRVTVRCRDGHLFTTLWIPAASVKSLRLGPWRLQRCPVGRHWSIVSPLRDASLSAVELSAARERTDAPIP